MARAPRCGMLPQPTAAREGDYASERVASWMAAAVRAAEDPRTLERWSRAAGASPRTIQYGCAAAGVSALRCRDLARILRLFQRSRRGEAWDPCRQLDSDPRTIRRLMTAAGVSRRSPPDSLDALFSGQSLLTSPGLMSALQRRLAEEGVGAADTGCPAVAEGHP